jgi:hypothetical protein
MDSCELRSIKSSRRINISTKIYKSIVSSGDTCFLKFPEKLTFWHERHCIRNVRCRGHLNQKISLSHMFSFTVCRIYPWISSYSPSSSGPSLPKHVQEKGNSSELWTVRVPTGVRTDYMDLRKLLLY